MRPRIRAIAIAALAAWAGGCSTTPKPYAHDPLVHDAKRQRGNFDTARTGSPYRDAEPVPPPSPGGNNRWVAATDWAAEAYTAMMYIARAMKSAGSVAPAALDKAMIALGKKGYQGVLGQNITVVKGQQMAKPVLVQWETGKAVPMANQNP